MEVHLGGVGTAPMVLAMMRARGDGVVSCQERMRVSIMARKRQPKGQRRALGKNVPNSEWEQRQRCQRQ